MAPRREDEPAGDGRGRREHGGGAAQLRGGAGWLSGRDPPKHDSAYYCGVETCGNVWLCPVCSAKIRHRRTDELRTALAAWDAAGHAASLATITVPHDLGDPLSRLVNGERSAWKKVTAGAAWQRLKRRLGIAGHVIALEFT